MRASSVLKVVASRLSIVNFCNTIKQRSNINGRSFSICFLSFLVRACVICSVEKSRISSKSSLKILRLLPHNDAWTAEDFTRAGTTFGQVCGHSCFKSWRKSIHGHCVTQ